MSTREHRDTCPGCGGTSTSSLMPSFELPALSHALHRSLETARQTERATVRLRFCHECGLIFNADFDPARLRYEGDYDNALHFSPRFTEYVEQLGRRLVERYRLKGKQIVEIGCGDGQFLRLLCQLGQNRGIGFDPVWRHTTADSDGATVQFRAESFDSASLTAPVDFICCRHVMEHLAAPTALLDGVRRSLRRDADAAVYFEVPNATRMLRTNDVWVLLYEHCLHFTDTSLARLVQRSGFEVLEIGTCYEGQFLAVEARPTTGKPRATQAAVPGVDRPLKLPSEFAAGARATIDEWEARLRMLAEGDQRVVLWGAGSRSITFLNLLSASSAITAVVDVNPRKADSFVAGSGHRIVLPAALRRLRQDVVLIMNSIYQQEITDQLGNLGLSCETMVVSTGSRCQQASVDPCDSIQGTARDV